MIRFQAFQRLATVVKVVQKSCSKRSLISVTAPCLQSRRSWATYSAALLGIMSASLYGLDMAESKSQEQKHYKYVIIGAGVAARSCLKTLIKNDKEPLEEDSNYHGKVLMIGNNPRINSLGQTEGDIINKEDSSHSSVALMLGYEVGHLDVQAKTVSLHDGTIIQFDKCFIATGGHYPDFKNVKPGAADRVKTFRGTGDLQALIDESNAGKIQHVTVVGGGSLGTEISLALRSKAPSLKVTQIYAEPGVLYRTLPEYFRAYCTALLRGQGVDQKNFSLISDVDVDKTTGRLMLTVDSWEMYYMLTDRVLFAPTHIDANTDLIASAGLEIDAENTGVVVNSELQAFSDVYVGGDAVSFPSKYLGRRREQNYDHAVQTGLVAAKNMMGFREVYDYVSLSKVSFKSIGINMTLVGNCDSHFETIGFWEMNRHVKKYSATDEQAFFTSKYGRGVAYYLDNGYIVGIILTNLDNKKDIDRARQIIMDQVDYSNLQGPELEQELRGQLCTELHTPTTRTTQSKSTGSGESKKAYKNIYKGRRYVRDDPLTSLVDGTKVATTSAA